MRFKNLLRKLSLAASWKSAICRSSYSLIFMHCGICVRGINTSIAAKFPAHGVGGAKRTQAQEDNLENEGFLFSREVVGYRHIKLMVCNCNFAFVNTRINSIVLHNGELSMLWKGISSCLMCQYIPLYR